MLSRTKRFPRTAVLISAGPLAVFLAGGLLLLGSRPKLNGELKLEGLSAPVSIQRDDLGVPQIQSARRTDLAFAMGFLHAQERFFQMDLMRRNAAGELAGLLGPSLVDYDLQMRRHDFHGAADLALAALPEWQRKVLESYTQGVNAGLEQLFTRPPEYFVLRQKPRPWKPQDSLMVGLLMFERLQDSTGYEDRRRAVLAQVLTPSVLDFFDPEFSEWDAPLDGTVLVQPSTPGPEAVQFTSTTPTPTPNESWESPLIPGSNAWGVDGSVSARGGAILANDMHLDLGLPNIWYRVSARWKDADSKLRQFDGITLPGTPVLLVGSNGEIAWGFTNATLDTTDVISLELDPTNPHRYRTPEGWRELEDHTEVIEVSRNPAKTGVTQRTIWGPVIGTNHLGQLQALRWIAHQPGAVNLQVMELETAQDVDTALHIAPTCGVPVQNLLVGDRHGKLAWTLIGRLPRRIGFDGRSPVSWADGSHKWDGWRPAEDYPRYHGDRLWTANNRITGQPNYMSSGAHLTDLGARARQIRDDLMALNHPDEKAVFELYRDDRALFLQRWQELLMKTLEQGSPHTNTAEWESLRKAVSHWGGRASTDSAGYRLVRAFRFKVGDLFFEPLIQKCRKTGSDLPVDSVRWEGPLWRCLKERPAHLLNPRFTSYDALLATAVDAVLADLKEQNITPAQATWGQRNTVRIQHPLSRALPKLGEYLDLAPMPLSGDDHMPKIQGVRFGPSERLVVSPGQEDHGLLQMPGGQSGHFLSPYYRAGHDAWEQVTPTPLLPGPSKHRLILNP